MNECKLTSFFISEKISTVRWFVEELKAGLKFISGSWDSPKNHVRIWQVDHTNSNSENEIKCIEKYAFDGDINGMEFLRSENLIVACSKGYITLLKIGEQNKPTLKVRSSLLHKFISGQSASCTALATYDSNIATVGDDGKLNIIDGCSFNVANCVQVDSCALTAVCYIKPGEILSSSRVGVIKMFDTRSLEQYKAAITFMNSCEDDRKSNYLSCLTYHPNQKHIVLAGSEEGSISVWDLRYQGFPVSYLNAHTSCVTAIGFQKSDLHQLLTTSENGELWTWSSNPTYSNYLESQLALPDSSLDPWLSGDRARSQITVTSLIEQRKAINSFDSYGSNIICGGDSETVFALLKF